jgi:Zn-dependent peptidase ImmA (M78 family)
VDCLPGVTPELLGQLTGPDDESWSAFTVAPPEMTLIVLNSAHIPARQESDLMHECSHLLCQHRPAELVTIPGLELPLRTFDPIQEEEADWLAGCLLLPRPAIELAVRRGMSDFQINQA